MILITRPKFDDTTNYLFSWSSEFVLLDSPCNLIELKKDKANKVSVESVLLKKKPEFVIFNGYGNSSTINGRDNEVLIDIENKHLLKSKIVYFIHAVPLKF